VFCAERREAGSRPGPRRDWSTEPGHLRAFDRQRSRDRRPGASTEDLFGQRLDSAGFLLPSSDRGPRRQRQRPTAVSFRSLHVRRRTACRHRLPDQVDRPLEHKVVGRPTFGHRPGHCDGVSDWTSMSRKCRHHSRRSTGRHRLQGYPTEFLFSCLRHTRQCRRRRYISWLSVRRVRPFVRSSGQILLSRCLT